MHESPTLPRPLVLGSTSRYRRELLSRLNLPFDVAAPQVDETPHDREPPKELALRLALAKARAVAALHPTAVVIGSDQVADFPKWHHYQSLLQEFPVLVYPRLPHPYPKLLPGMRSLSHFPIIDISSTQIRHLQAIGDKTWQTLVIQ